MNRFLNIGYAIEVINGRLNGSAEEVETKKNSNGNTTFVKKIGNRGTVSAQCQKWNIQNFVQAVEKLEKSSKTFKKGEGTKKANIEVYPHPAKYFNDDIFGFMMASGKTEITVEEYEELDQEHKSSYRLKGKGRNQKYEKIGSGTFKRKSNFLMSHIINVTNNKIETEWAVASADNGKNLPLQIETYAGVFSGIANINLNKIGKFTISDEDLEFRDYSSELAETLKVENLDKEEKLRRIKAVLRGLEYLSIQGNQNNYLTDTKPKFVIFSEYSWGNNVFQGIINKQGLDVEMLREAIEQNEEFRLTDIYIGINKFFDEKYNEIREQLKELEYKFDCIKVENVHNTFKNYINYLEQNLK